MDCVKYRALLTRRIDELAFERRRTGLERDAGDVNVSRFKSKLLPNDYDSRDDRLQGFVSPGDFSIDARPDCGADRGNLAQVIVFASVSREVRERFGHPDDRSRRSCPESSTVLRGLFTPGCARFKWECFQIAEFQVYK